MSSGVSHERLFKIVFIFALILCLAQGGHAEESTLPKSPYILSETVKRWQNDGRKVQLIDVREPEEYKEGHLPGAINIPHWQIDERADELRGKQEKVVYCISSSWRAPYSANTLLDLGVEYVYVLEGGISAWNAGGQVIYADGAAPKAKIANYPKNLSRELKHPSDRNYDQKIELTLEELRDYDGKDGRPAYVAVNGAIYDLTQSRLWRGGEHDPSHGMAKAGRDLTELIKESPHGEKNLQRFPVVGVLVEKQ